MIIALASPGVASTLDEGLDKIKQLLSEASAQSAEIVCFPEAYLPGLRGQDFEGYSRFFAAQVPQPRDITNLLSQLLLSHVINNTACNGINSHL